MAVQSIANIVKSSLGPVGLDKMLVDDIGDVVITNDGATILSLLEIEHPAAKMLVELAAQQDAQVGDGTTSVVLLAAALLKEADELVRLKVHPTVIISGFRMALKECCKFLAEQMAVRVDALGKDGLVQIAKTCLASKILGAGGLDLQQLGAAALPAIALPGVQAPVRSSDVSFDHFFAAMAVEAMQAVRGVGPKGEPRYNVNAVHILKAHGQSQRESQLIKGYALNCTLASSAMKKKVTGVRVACLDMNLQRIRMPLGVNILVTNPDDLEAIRRREMDITTERIQKILAAGANVVLTTKGIDDTCMKLFIQAGAMAVRRCQKEDLKRIAKATGATLLSSLANLEGEESFDASLLGSAETCAQVRIGDDECIVISGPKMSGVCSIILRGANDTLLDEMERALHDALCVIKRTLESNTVVPGGGAVEAALSTYLEAFATTLGSREQLAISKFAEALLIIPRTLAVNAAKDASDLISQLAALHYAAQSSPTGKPCHHGLDLINGTVRDNIKAGVIEPALIKLKSLKAATEAAISILRIDDLIKVEKPPQDNPQDHCE